MLRKLLVLALFSLPVTALSAQTVEEVISKYVQTRGGLEKIKSVKSERVTGTISFGAEAEGGFVVERERPLKMHMEITLNGQPFIRTYDGKSSGWIYNPFAPNPSVQAMTADDLRNIFDEADFDGPFVDYQAKGNKLEFVDKEEVLGKTAYKIKLTNKLGDVSYFSFDADGGLILKWEGDRMVAGKTVPWESFFHDYRDINGIKYPFLIESDAPGTNQVQKIMAQKIETNMPIDQARFGKPTPPPLPTDTVPDAPKSDAPKSE
jgi:outer membrane lipoprotein-sorting protein